MKKLLTILALLLSLQGCIFVAGAAAGAAAVAVVYDHRKLQLIVQDQKINNAIVEKIHTNSALREQTHINVTTFNQVVLLTGEAPSSELRAQAEEAAHSVENVTHVYNEISVQGPSSSLSRTSDAWITAKIKTQMLATKDLQSGTIKVITENGSVYLMGMVTHEQANAAVYIAKQASGVQRVMKIFQYKDQ